MCGLCVLFKCIVCVCVCLCVCHSGYLWKPCEGGPLLHKYSRRPPCPGLWVKPLSLSDMDESPCFCGERERNKRLRTHLLCIAFPNAVRGASDNWKRQKQWRSIKGLRIRIRILIFSTRHSFLDLTDSALTNITHLFFEYNSNSTHKRSKEINWKGSM